MNPIDERRSVRLTYLILFLMLIAIGVIAYGLTKCVVALLIYMHWL